ncbi:hypothetical protein ACFP1H_11360 [Secundilactobacillus hailunensis]|uniref:Uncharacterized protein n=1 Tax=Secundilactobacillus hailunensis TaxID=2559923 RepID=A0ABW1TC18_9LACO|nr:hypothetical protein [Secundilactobacillus hailunensis]
MKKAIFLVTSLTGVKKLTFKQKVASLMNDQVKVTIILAMISFDDYEVARHLIQSLFQANQLKQLNVVSLATLMADEPGIDIAVAEQFKNDFKALPAHRFEATNALERTTIRYIKNDEIVAEVKTDSNEVPLLETRFDNHQPVQSAVYEAGKQFGILNYQDGELAQALLLNQQGQLVYRFIRHTHQVNFAYTMGRSSKLAFTELIATEDEEHHVVYQESAEQSYYEVVGYQNYDRFNTVYAFYANLLQQVVVADTGLFIDLNDGPQLTPYLPQQLIFNY